MGGFDLIIIPDEEDSEDAGGFVDGTVDGHEYRFLLDTGAAKTTVALDDYTSTLAPLGRSSSSGVFARRSDNLVVTPSITVGPITRTDFTVLRLASRELDTRNLIGMDLLKNQRCHFFFDKNRVWVDSDEEMAGAFDLQDLFLDGKSHPDVDARWGEHGARAVWDTGAGITVVDMNFVDRHPPLFQEVGRSFRTVLAGTTVETPMFLMAASVIGGGAFLPHKVAGVDLAGVNATIEVPMDLILVYSTLRQANWWFDFPRRKWAISKLLSVMGTRSE